MSVTEATEKISEDNDIDNERFHKSRIFYEGNLERIKEEYEKDPSRFTHGCYYIVSQVADKECMKFLLEKKIPNPWPDNFWEFVSEPLDLDYLKWVHEDMKVPLTSGAFWGPATYGMLDMVKYLLEKNCPWDGKTVMLLKESHAEVTDENDNIISNHQECWNYFKSVTKCEN